jgi:hypothetical protein
MHYAINDGSGDTPYSKVNCTRKSACMSFLSFLFPASSSDTFPVIEWPQEFLVQSRFLGVNPVNGKQCNHFYAPGVAVDGKDKQLDVWTSKGVSRSIVDAIEMDGWLYLRQFSFFFVCFL